MGFEQQMPYYWIDTAEGSFIIKHPFHKKLVNGKAVPNVPVPENYYAAYTLPDVFAKSNGLFPVEELGQVPSPCFGNFAQSLVKRVSEACVETLTSRRKAPVTENKKNNPDQPVSPLDIFYTILNHNHNGKDH